MIFWKFVGLLFDLNVIIFQSGPDSSFKQKRLTIFLVWKKKAELYVYQLLLYQKEIFSLHMKDVDVVVKVEILFILFVIIFYFQILFKQFKQNMSLLSTCLFVYFIDNLWRDATVYSHMMQLILHILIIYVYFMMKILAVSRNHGDGKEMVRISDNIVNGAEMSKLTKW